MGVFPNLSLLIAKVHQNIPDFHFAFRKESWAFWCVSGNIHIVTQLSIEKHRVQKVCVRELSIAVPKKELFDFVYTQGFESILTKMRTRASMSRCTSNAAKAICV